MCEGGGVTLQCIEAKGIRGFKLVDPECFTFGQLCVFSLLVGSACPVVRVLRCWSAW